MTEQIGGAETMRQRHAAYTSEQALEAALSLAVPERHYRLVADAGDGHMKSPKAAVRDRGSTQLSVLDRAVSAGFHGWFA
jgi:hypothetical protein